MTITDPTFYRSPAEAIAAPTEQLAYVVAFDRAGALPDALAVIDVDASSDAYGTVVGWTDLPTTGDELHHFGWNACSSALMHEGHDMGGDGLKRRFLLLPGLRSSNIHVYDTQPDPRSPTLHKTVTAKELAERARDSRPHTLDCRPDGVFLTCLAGPTGTTGRAASRCWTTPRSTSSGRGRPTAGRSTWPTTPGGTCGRTSWCRASGAPPR